MGRIFGNKWVSSYGAADDGTWEAGLIDLTEDQVRAGVMECLSWPKEWPPTLPEFRGLCLKFSQESKISHESHRMRPQALPEPGEARKARCAKALSHLAGWKEERRYLDWLMENQARRESPAEAMFRVMRAMMKAAKATA